MKIAQNENSNSIIPHFFEKRNGSAWIFINFRENFGFPEMNGNLNPHFVLRFAADELVQIALLVCAGRRFACNLRRVLAAVILTKRKGRRLAYLR